MWTFLGVVMVFASGYIASAYTWPTLRTWVSGVETEITKLQIRIRSLGGAPE